MQYEMEKRMSEGRPEVSVIIPAYNAAEVIERAVKSIKAQKELTWELIIVENGSTDGTFEKCQAFVREDDRISVYQSEKGVSRARNLGIEKARGTWLCFLDADDYLYPAAFTAVSDLLHRAGSYDLVLFDHNSDVESTQGEVESYLGKDAHISLWCKMLKTPTKYMTVWGKFFSRAIIVDNHLAFDTDLALAEDSDFTFRYMQVCQNAVLTTAQLYHYSRDEGSTVRTYKTGMDEKYMQAMIRTEQYAEQECEAVQRAFQQYIATHLILILVHDTFAEANPASGSEKKAHMKKLLETELFAQAIQQIPLSECKSFRMLPILCFKMHLNFAAVWMVKMRIRQNRKK